MKGRGAIVVLDGGNSKTDAAVIARDGHVLARAIGGGFRGEGQSVAVSAADLRELVAGVVAAAGSPEIDVIAAYLANVDFPDEDRQAREAIASWRLTDTIVMGNDTLALLRSGVSEPVGVAVVCGAGSNAIGIGPDGRVAAFPGIGVISGDWGGGGQLANEVMFHASRAEDGRGPATDLSRRIAERFQVSGALELAGALHLGRVPATTLTELVPLLFDAAAGGDAVARSIVERQAEEVAALAVSALRRCGLASHRATVVLGGGVLAARHRLLNDRAEELILERCPRARIVVPSLPPLYGAALLAFDELIPDREVRSAVDARLARDLARFPARTPALIPAP